MKIEVQRIAVLFLLSKNSDPSETAVMDMHTMVIKSALQNFWDCSYNLFSNENFAVVRAKHWTRLLF